MRKKISSVLIGILLIFAGVFSSACGDKYKKFEFKVTYAFSEDAENWYNANDGVSLNYLYDEDEDEYVFDINGNEERVDKDNFNIYIKVDIKNVKSKHLDSVTVSAEDSSGLAFSSTTIKEGGTVTLPVVGLVNSQLKLYENKSGKSKKIDLSVYGKLKDITRNEDITPAITVGNSIDLNAIKNLVFYNKDGITTNQTGVDYKIVEFGSFASNTFVPVSQANNQQLKQFVSLTNGKLKLNKTIRTVGGEREFELTAANSVLKVKAISNYSPKEPTVDNPEIATDLYVYIIENNLSAPVITFAGTETNVNDTIAPGLDLYFNSEIEKYEDLNKYSKTEVEVQELNSVYQNDNIVTADGKTLKFKVFAYIDGTSGAYDFETGDLIRNLRLEESGNKYAVSLLSKSVEKDVNIKFAYRLVCENGEEFYPVKFTEAEPKLETNVLVRKHILASSILINGEKRVDGEEIEDIIYSSSHKNNTGYSLNLAVDPFDQYNPQTTTVSGIADLDVTDEYGFKVNNNATIGNNKTLKIKFKSNIYNKQTVTISTLRTPTFYNGKDFTDPKYVSVNLSLTRKITADALEFVEPIDADNYKETSTINVAANNSSYIYIKAYHKSELQTETITLLSTNFALNANGDKKLLLSKAQATLVETGYINVETGERFSIYKLEIPKTGSVSSSKLTVYAGEMGNGASKDVELKSVDLINDASKIVILPKGNSQVEAWDNTKFAVAKGEEVAFNVVETVSGEIEHKTIQSVTLNAVAKADLAITDSAIKNNFGDAEVLTKTEFKNSNVFNVYGWNAKTRVFNVNVKYYDQIDVDGDGKDDIVSLLTYTIENVQFAVYNPITTITMTATNPKVAYVNSMFLEAATTEIKYSSYSGVGAEMPTESVYFFDSSKAGGYDEKTGATSVQISIDKDLKDAQQVQISYKDGDVYRSTGNNKILLETAGVDGSLKLQLTNPYTRDRNIKFSIVAKRFGRLSSTQKDITVIFAQVRQSKGFNITKGDITENLDGTQELRLSFMDAADNVVSKKFTATPIYEGTTSTNTLQFDDMSYLLYKYSFVNGVQQFEADGKTPKLIPITSNANSLQVDIVDNEIIVSADRTKLNIGGQYKLILVTKDSYNDNTKTYGNTYTIDVRVSDGKTIDAAYIITSPDEFVKINNDLAAHYVLGNNITIPSDKFTPIGYNEKTTSVTPFTGTLSGKLSTTTNSGSSSISNFNLNVTINGDSKKSTDGNYGQMFGLFTILEGTVSNLNIHIGFAESVSTAEKSTIGGIAAVNRGTIHDVYAYLSGKVAINNETNFGGLVGLNENITKTSGQNYVGKIERCVVESPSVMTIDTKAKANIGGIAGVNNGVITGKYQTKEDLNEIVYDAIVNIKINDNKEGSTLSDFVTYNIGAIAGTSSQNISNLIVGGKIELTSKKDNATSPNNKGYIAGIVGTVGDSTAQVSTVAAIGLDIINNGKNDIVVAGIAGKAYSVYDARFVSVLTKFGTTQVLGQLIGDTVAGIAYDAHVEYSTVESFISTVDDKIFYTLNGKTVYGLVCSGSVVKSFVSANINATDAYLTSNVTETSTYFIGKVKGNTIIKSTYAVIIADDDKNLTLSGFDKFDASGLAYYVEDNKLKTEDWKSVVIDKDNNNVDDTDFAINEAINIINVSTYPEVYFFFPYILDTDGNPLMILQPTSIGVAINQNYQISTEKNIYINKVNISDDKTPATYTITESIIVDFFENENNNNSDINRHRLINDLCENCSKGEGVCDEPNCHKGLINAEVLPSGSVGGLKFELIENYVDIATIEYDTDEKATFIKFSGVTNGNPVIIRVYSLFNPDAEAYFALYSQRTFTKFVLNGATIENDKTNDADYITNIYKGKNTIFSINAENIIDGINYDSIFAKNSSYIKVECIEEVGGKVEVKTDNLTSMSVSILDTYSLLYNGEPIKLTFNVYLDKSYFGDYNKFADTEIGLKLGSVTLKAYMFNVASDLLIVGSNDFEIDTSSTLNIEANLKTGYVDASDSKTDEVELTTDVVDGVVIVGGSTNKDFIKMTISSTSEELDRIKTLTKSASYVDLFDFEVYSIRYDEGYKYFISMTLKDGFNYRYITTDIDLTLEIQANSDKNIQNAVLVKIKPTTANTTRLVNYAVEKVNTVSSTKSELTIGNIETSIISPGGRGNIILAYVEKSYSNIDSISISSSDLYVPELSKEVNLVFTQYVYNTDTRKFETLFNSNVQAQKGKTLQLQKVTTINNSGTTEYTGLLYIHVQLVKFSGLEARITASLNVTSNGKELPVVTRDLTTTFLPGASMTYVGKQFKNGYLIQEETYENNAKIRLYGYQFNSNPVISANWELVDGVDYFYKLNTDNIAITDNDIIKESFDKGTLYYKQNGKYYKANSDADYNDKTNKTFYSITSKKVIVINGGEHNVTDYITTYMLKDYNNVEYNSVDGSYTMDIKFNIAKNIPTSFSLQASLSLITSEGQIESAQSDKIVFYPTKYIVTGVSVKDTPGYRKMLAINRTDKFELIFSTSNTDYDYSTEIYENVFVDDISNLKELFSYYNPSQITFADNAHPEFDVAVRKNENNKYYLNITGLSKFEKEITLKVWLGYEPVNGKYEIVFTEGAGEGIEMYEYTFLLQIYPGAGEENATPIYYAHEIFGDDGTCKLAENGHYILMDDITLDMVKPIDYAIGSLDGNNHIIKIKNFAIDPSKTEYGLFANIGTYQDEEGKTHKTILKNVIVDYSEFNLENGGNLEFINNGMSTIKFGGLVATNNGGLIYNCDVINSNSAVDKNINIITDANAQLTFGGLVGSNSGVITNSRVGRREFKDIDAKKNTHVDREFGGLTFTLGSSTASGFDSIAGGFVGENSGTISSSYFANSSLINYSNSKDLNITAGFAGRNTSGTIVYSYVKADETTIKPSVPYATGARIEGKSNGIVAGFVYENAGTINDCYANTELYTHSTYMAGFVYTNLTSGVISESYAACTMDSAMSGTTQDNAEQPFIGKDSKDNYLNAGTMANNYYLISESGSGDVNSTLAQALNTTNFSNPNNLQGFVFVQSNVAAERQQGVWSHIDLKGNAVILPELMNANSIAHSAKYLYSGNGIDEKFTYTNADSYVEGSQNNPYIIRNVQEYNSILTGDRQDMSKPTAKSGYIRLIDNIDFGEDQDAIKTRVKYSLGDENKANITSFEGNGLSISGIYFDVSEPGIREIGLFATINYAYVKNLNLNFAEPKADGQYSTTLVKYSGGLAGIVTNSAIINVNLNGKNVSLTGENYVGGIAGMVKGDSLLFGISSNLSVSATSPVTSLYYNEKDFVDMGNSANSYNSYIANLSYAGGLAGVIDVTKRSNTDYNVAYIDIHGDEMFVKTSDNGVQLPNIAGQYAGGIAGFASEKTSSLKLKYHVGVSDWISGSVAAGGLYGVSLGKMKASQVTAVEDTQYKYDEEFSKYILDIDNKTIDSAKVGNTKLIESNNYAGGLIGIGLGAGIDSSYSKASIKDGKVIGGLIGAAIASSVTYSYAVPFVNITDKTKLVGGMFGLSQVVEKDQNYTGDNLAEYKNLVRVYANREIGSSRAKYTDIQFTFSSLLLDKKNIEEKQVSTTDSNSAKLGYIVPVTTNNEYVNSLRSGGNQTFSSVYSAYLDEYNYTKQGESSATVPVATIEEKVKNKDLKIIYDLSNTKQETTFNEIFSSWKSIPYWTIKHEKYFPLLTSEGVENYTIIEDAEDMKQISSNLDGKYLIVNDINMNGINAGNWVFKGTFTGELIGQIDSGSNKRKRLYNISLTPSQKDSSGFFEQTQGALISDLEFVWFDGGNGAIAPTQNLTNVSGLSCMDTPYIDGENSEFSEFSNVEVSVSGDGYLINDDTHTINSFGGLVASTESSTITNCDFVGKTKVTLSKPSNGEESHFGGLVGRAEKYAGKNATANSMSIMNSKIGANGEDLTKKLTSFDITLKDCKQAYIGGLAGYTSNTSILGASVGGANNVADPSDYRIIPISVTFSQDLAGSQKIAGLIGHSDESAISTCDAYTSISVSDGNADKVNNSYVAGLIAYATYEKMDILNSNANAKIDVSKLTTSTIYTAGGIAYVQSNSDNSDFEAIKQCLFIGEIISESTQTPQAGAQPIENVLKAKTMVAGGAVATSAGKVKISETMSTVDITIGTNIAQEHTLKAGGFVGLVSSENSTLTLNNVVSTGKLVPFCGENAKDIHLGGMLGSVDDGLVANIYNSYTLTSIISDGINGKVLPKVYSDALIGYYNKPASETDETATNVYYSTDYALTTNKNYGTNLSANDFVFSDNSLWKTDFVSASANVWEFIKGSPEGRLPYLKALEDNLKKYNTLVLVGSNYDYVEGSALCPSLNFNSFNDSFTYYLLSNVSGQIDDAELKGVLIGKEQEFSVAKDTTNTVALIETISKHSAVSNVHLTLGENQTHAISGNIGFVASINNGLIFNSSVQGKSVKISGGSSLGLITNTNNGKVAYSYSTAEIISVESIISGIAHTNAGTIDSCYFTGYINNDTQNAAGIITLHESDMYVYNSYMAGVIEIIQEGHTSFFADDSANIVGFNNYIDQYANIENVSVLDASNNVIIQSVSTAELMTRAKLIGNWYETVKEDDNGNVDIENVKIDTSSESFGKNYGYPIHKFNKMYANGTTLYCSDLNYSVYTGTGETEKASVDEMYTALTDTSNLVDNKEYNDSYKIPHLGILSAVQGLQDIARNYVVIYDIDGKMTEWTAVGSSSVAQGFALTDNFKGVFITNKYLSNSTTVTGGGAAAPASAGGTQTVTKELCLIQGLTNQGLFANIENAYFADMVLGSFGAKVEGTNPKPGLQNSGALGTNVIGSTKVNGISFIEDSVIEGANVAALFGSIASEVTITNFSTQKGTDTLPALTLQGGGSAGLITATLGVADGTTITSGTINLDIASQVAVATAATPTTNKLIAFFKGFDIVGGLVGTIYGGTINGNANVINLDNNAGEETISSFGDIVGQVSEKCTAANINNVEVNFYQSEALVTANSFGGFVADVKGNVAFSNCVLTVNSKLKIQSKSQGHKGMVIGSISSTEAKTGEVTINNFKLTNAFEIEFVGDKNSESSIGGIVGYQNGNLTLSYADSGQIKLITKDTPNLGGIIGFYEGGKINISEFTNGAGTAAAGSGAAITLQGCSNVGGFIGFAKTFPTIVDGSKDFLSLACYANIVITENATTNFGGIFGVLCDSNIKNGVTEPNYIAIKNSNTFKIEKIKNNTLTPLVTNIGGVVGSVEGKDGETGKTFASLGNLINTVELKFSDALKYKFTNVGGVIGKFVGESINKAENQGAIKTYTNYENAISSAEAGDKDPCAVLMNVGGIIGLVDSYDGQSTNTMLTGLKSTVDISGYQNVGGLIGYAIKADIQGDIQLTEGEYLAMKSDGTVQIVVDGANPTDASTVTESVAGKIAGVVNVGGAIGYIEESTIKQIRTTANVYGNVNVGGLIGLSNNNNIINNYVGFTEEIAAASAGTPSVLTIKAVYYNAHFLVEGATPDYITYIPTSVGGLIGTAAETQNIKGNLLNKVQILSTEEGKETGSSNAKSKGIISTIENHMAKIGVGEGSVGIDNFKDKEKLYVLGNEDGTKVTVKFSEITSGFGGFIGTIGEIKSISTDECGRSYMKDITINASLGVNVGTFFGVYVHVNNNFNAPTLFGTINVDGAYNIGGLAGFVTGENIGTVDKSFSDEDLLGQFTIKIQSNLMGMYVGGFFGKSTSLAEYLSISNDKFEIYTNSSYYVGGLVGKLEVSSGNIFVGKVARDAATSDPIERKQLKVTSSEITDIRSAQNFGGLVGMLKCVGGGTYNVNGEHYYPFTVNTIENQNYADGKSQFDTELVDENVNLYAQANYINKDSFNISASQGNFYNTNSKNPLNTDSWGWSKEYTGFKQMQRCIPQSGIWDSIAVVYNAEWITEVGTVGNLGLNTEVCSNDCSTVHTHLKVDDNGKLFYLKVGDPNPVYIDDQHIVYTIYKKNQDVEMLYSAIGIAEIAQFAGENINADKDTSYTVYYNGKNNTINGASTDWYTHDDYKGIEDNINTIAEYYYIRNMNENYELMGWYQKSDSPNSSEPGYQKTLYYVSDSIPRDIATLKAQATSTPKIRSFNKLNASGLLYFNWSNNIEFINCIEAQGENNADLKCRSEGAFKLHYFKSKKGEFYDFRVIYANDTLADAGYAKYSNIDLDNVPNSGSVFEIYGLSPTLESYEGVAPGSWWNKWGKWVLLAIEIALDVVGAGWLGKVAKLRKLGKAAKLTHKTWNATQKAMKGMKNAQKLASKAWAAGKKLGKLTAKVTALAISTTALFGATIGTLISNLSSSYTAGIAGSRNLYYDVQDQNFGLLTSTTTTEIRYNNNTMVGSLGSTLKLTENGEEYEFFFYSNVRPSDYYKNYYIIPKQEYETNNDLIEQGFTEGIAFDDPRIKDIGSLYSFDFVISSTVNEDGSVSEQKTTAEIKYIYHEGAYYANSSAMTAGKYRTQELSDPSLVAATEAQAVYGSDGIAYVLGEYKCSESGCTGINCNHDKTYKFSKHGGLNQVVQNDDGTYSLNGNNNINAEKEVDVEFVGVSQSAYEIVTSKSGVAEGYDYLKNAYYTTLGTATINPNYTRYAKYTYWEEYYDPSSTINLSNYTEGVDYIKVAYTLVEEDETYGTFYYDTATRTYKEISSYIPTTDVNGDGELNYLDYVGDKFVVTPNQTVLFEIDSMVESDSVTGQSLGYITNLNFSDKSVTVVAYPTCFKDPYVIKPSGGYKDDKYYIHKSHSSGTDNPTFKFNVKYYYFEGGYMLWQDFGAESPDPRPSIINTAFTFDKDDGTQESVTLDDMLQNAIYTKIDLEGMLNAGYSGSVMLWDENEGTSGDFVSIPLVNNESEKDNADALIWRKEDGTYYFDEESIKYYIDPVEKDASESDLLLKYSKRVDINYIIYDNSVWVREEEYSLDNEGYINKIYLYNNIKSKDADFVANRYLSYNNNNGYKGVYTMFKYTKDNGNAMNLYFDKDTTVWKLEDENNNANNEYYYLIPTNPNRSRPNTNVSATYLVESCKVVLGGGVTLNYTKGSYSSNGPTSGTITIE